MADQLFLPLVLDDESDISLEDDEDIFLFAAVVPFMRRNLNRSLDFFEVTVPEYFGDEFQSHFRLSRNTAEILTREVVATGNIPYGNNFGRASIPPEKQCLMYLWMMANGREATRQVADRFDVTMSSCARVLRRVNTALLTLRQRYIKWPNGKPVNNCF